MIGDSLKYKYLNNNSPNEKIDYSYSTYHGEDFINAWKKSRLEFIEQREIKNLLFEFEDENPTKSLFNNWIHDLLDGNFEDTEKLNLLLKRFEVTKKIYDSYDSDFRPTEKTTEYKNIQLYILFSYILALAYTYYKKLYYLNSLLKVNDIIISNEDSIASGDWVKFNHCIEKEIKFIYDLRKELI